MGNCASSKEDKERKSKVVVVVAAEDEKEGDKSPRFEEYDKRRKRSHSLVNEKNSMINLFELEQKGVNLKRPHYYTNSPEGKLALTLWIENTSHSVDWKNDAPEFLTIKKYDALKPISKALYAFRERKNPNSSMSDITLISKTVKDNEDGHEIIFIIELLLRELEQEIMSIRKCIDLDTQINQDKFERFLVEFNRDVIVIARRMIEEQEEKKNTTKKSPFVTKPEPDRRELFHNSIKTTRNSVSSPEFTIPTTSTAGESLRGRIGKKPVMN